MQIHNTNTQIHKYKYTNTVWVKFADTPNMCYIFGKPLVQGPQRQCSKVSDMQIQICKYTKTISFKVSHRPNICYIFEMVMVQGPQKQWSRVCDMQIHKYKFDITHNTEVVSSSSLMHSTGARNDQPLKCINPKLTIMLPASSQTFISPDLKSDIH